MHNHNNRSDSADDVGSIASMPTWIAKAQRLQRKFCETKDLSLRIGESKMDSCSGRRMIWNRTGTGRLSGRCGKTQGDSPPTPVVQGTTSDKTAETASTLDADGARKTAMPTQAVATEDAMTACKGAQKTSALIVSPG